MYATGNSGCSPRPGIPTVPRACRLNGIPSLTAVAATLGSDPTARNASRMNAARGTRRIALRGEPQLGHDQVSWVEAWVQPDEPHEAARQESRAREQHHRQGELSDDQRVVGPVAPGLPALSPRAAASGLERVRGRLPRGP